MATQEPFTKKGKTILHEETRRNRLRLKTTIMSVRWLALQGCSFSGHDESENSSNRGNVIELIDFIGKLNADVKSVVLGNAPKNAKYTSPDIQKEILAIMANRVRRMIREEIGDACFSLIVDEALVESDRAQMAIILRFVNNAGILIERLFAIKGDRETSSETLKQEIFDVLAQYNLQVHKLRGQAYDGASIMRGQWNELQALFLRDCPYAYHVHCFAHGLQLTLVAVAKQCDPIWGFVSQLDNVINIVKSSHLQAIYKAEIENMLARGKREMLASGECEHGQWANQMTLLQRLGATRWSSYYESVVSIIDMYAAICEMLEDLLDSTLNLNVRADILHACENIQSFDFVFGLHVMRAIMRITDFLCQAFQKESVDILAAVRYVSIATNLLQELRQQGWEKLLQEVKDFCSKYGVSMPDLDSTIGRGQRKIIAEHHYHFDIFNKVIDFQLIDLGTRFNKTSIQLLKLSEVLDPKNSFQSFNADDIYELAVEFYPEDFEQQERKALRSELQFYREDVIRDPQFQVPTLAKLCEKLVETRRSEDYRMITRLIRLVLTLPVSKATTERAFSAMEHVNCSQMDDEFLDDHMTIFVERDLVNKIDIDSIIDEFAARKHLQSQLT